MIFSDGLTEEGRPMCWKEGFLLLGRADEVIRVDPFRCSCPLVGSDGLENIWHRQQENTYKLRILVPVTEVLCFECDITMLRGHKVFG